MVSLLSLFPNGFTATNAQTQQYIKEDNPRSAFMDEVKAYGFTDGNRSLPPSPSTIGQLIRCSSPTDKIGRKSGWYIYNEFEDEYRQGAYVGVGVFGSWKGDPEKVVWVSKRKEAMSTQEQNRLADQIKVAQAAKQAELEKNQTEAAIYAQQKWSEYTEATASHNYLQKKKIKPHGTRIDIDGRLVVPVKDDNNIVSLQYISDSFKKFLPSGKTKGCWYSIGDPTETIYICEGFATGATIHEVTGSLTYCAFNTNNLEPVTGMVKGLFPDALIVVAGDDDTWTDGNPGRSKANATADIHQVRAVFPKFSNIETKPTDFNDLAMLEGLESVKNQLKTRHQVYEHKAQYDAMPEDLLNIPGALGEIANYYNATARVPQPGFAVQTAIAIGSIIMGRNYRSTKSNHTSLYMMNVAKSGTGKEHSKTVIEEVLAHSSLDHLVNGSGYTSAGAVFSTLLRRPRHITIIDEFGRYLEAATGQKNAMLLEANTQLMEAIGRCHGTMRPTAYSTMTLSAEKAEEMANRKIYNPAITLMGMTTPAALFRNISSNNVADGFLGRFIIHQSNQPRMVHDDKDLMEMPRRIIDWCEHVNDRAHNDGLDDLSQEFPVYVTLPFSGEALALIREFNQWCVDLCDSLDEFGMDALPGRSKEMSMRLALIIAISIDHTANVISEEATRWAISYVKFSTEQTVTMLKMKVSASEHEGDKKSILEAIRKEKGQGVNWKEMQKRPPFSGYKSKDLKEIIQSLIDAELIILDDVHSDKPGRPRRAYIALA